MQAIVSGNGIILGDGPLEGVELRHWLQTQGVDNYHLHGRQANETVRDWLNKTMTMHCLSIANNRGVVSLYDGSHEL